VEVWRGGQRGVLQCSGVGGRPQAAAMCQVIHDQRPQPPPNRASHHVAPARLCLCRLRLRRVPLPQLRHHRHELPLGPHVPRGLPDLRPLPAELRLAERPRRPRAAVKVVVVVHGADHDGVLLCVVCCVRVGVGGGGGGVKAVTTSAAVPSTSLHCPSKTHARHART